MPRNPETGFSFGLEDIGACVPECDIAHHDVATTHVEVSEIDLLWPCVLESPCFEDVAAPIVHCEVDVLEETSIGSEGPCAESRIVASADPPHHRMGTATGVPIDDVVE